MKMIIVIATLFCAGTLFAQDVKKPEWREIAGTWRGHYEDSGLQKPIIFNFVQEGTCTLEMPDQAIKNSVCQVMICEAGDFHITKSGPGRTFTFVGRPDNNTMNGKYKMGESCGPGERLEFRVERISQPSRSVQ
jgi:hypothetical protein